MSKLLDLGHDHTLEFVSYKGDEYAGANVAHNKPDGSRCNGFITIKGSAWDREFNDPEVASWEMSQVDPITLTPSLLCRVCGDHGFVREGKWVPA
jgi:hypothetical protein